MSFEDLLRDLPAMHSWDGGITWNSGGFDPWHLEALADFLRKHVPANPTFLETGAGLSTVTLLHLNPSKLISIAPDDELFERIRATCRKFGISDAPLEAHVKESQWILPPMAAAKRGAAPDLDFLLIDGGHGWPIAFVDLEYGNALLKEGGYLLVDDVQLHSLKEMARLITEHPAFVLALDLGKALVFRKIRGDRGWGEWNKQPYIMRRSKEYEAFPNPFALEPPSVPALVSGYLRRLPGNLAALFQKT